MIIIDARENWLYDFDSLAPLRVDGFEVTVATTLKVGIRCICELLPHIVVVNLIQAGTRSELQEVVKACDEASLGGVIVVVPGTLNAETVRTALKAGAYDCIAKSDGVEGLRAVIHEWAVQPLW